MTRSRQSIVLIGRPNVGKTSVFNRLTGLNLKTANYGGVTVEHAEGTLTLQGEQVTLVDLPGACSLSPHSPDEALISSTLIMGDLGVVDLVISVIDANRLVESLYLTLQVIELGYPTVVAINQLDVAREMGVSLDMKGLQADLQCPVVGISAKTGEGLEELLTVAQHTLTQSTPVQLKSEPSQSEYSRSESSQSEPTHRALPWTEPLPPQSRQTALWSLIKGEYSGDQLTYDAIVQWAIHTAHLTESPLSPTMRLLALEASPVLSSVCEERIQRRYDWLDQKFLAWVTQETQPNSSSTPLSTTQHIDRWVLHPFFGSIIFFLWMLILFQLLSLCIGRRDL